MKSGSCGLPETLLAQFDVKQDVKEIKGPLVEVSSRRPLTLIIISSNSYRD